MKNISAPSKEECSKYLEKEIAEHYTVGAKAVTQIFKLYPTNTVLEEVLIKVLVLNDLYSTNILGTYAVAKHIIGLHIDERLKNGDASLVTDIAHIELNGKEKHFYSFATKYCAMHQPERFPIYDRFVGEMLRYFRKQTRFTRFANAALKNYAEYRTIYDAFIQFFALNDFTYRQVDNYLWKLGKEHVQEKGKKEKQ